MNGGRMRIGVVLSDGHEVGQDAGRTLGRDRELIAALRGRVDGITLHHGWATAPRWNLQALTAAAFLSAEADPLHLTVRGLPLGVLNPIELAEQLGTVDHAWDGRFSAGLSVGSALGYGAYGIDPAVGPSRFEEGLGLMRRMWALEPFAGDGPHFVFSEVRPTLRPVQDGGPPLSLRVLDAHDARFAARCDLGLHLEIEAAAAARDEVVAAYRGAGGVGEVSLEVGFDDASAADLSRFADAGYDHVDVRLRRPGDAPDAVLTRVDELSGRAAGIR